MQVYFNANGTINRIPVSDTVLFKNSGNFNYIYLYGIPAGETVTVSYTRQDGKQNGPYQASYGTDPEGASCVVVRIPADALTVAGQLQIFILAQHDIQETVGEQTITTTVRHAYAGITATVFDNEAVVVP